MTTHLKRLRLRLRYWLDQSKRQQLLLEEMEFHIESIARELIAQGTPEQEARAAARRKFGNLTRKSDESRTTWIARWISDAAQDLRYTFRTLRRDAGFTTFAICSNLSTKPFRPGAFSCCCSADLPALL